MVCNNCLKYFSESQFDSPEDAKEAKEVAEGPLCPDCFYENTPSSELKPYGVSDDKPDMDDIQFD